MACCCGLPTPCFCPSARETLTETIGPDSNCAPAGSDLLQGVYVLNRVQERRFYYAELNGPTTCENPQLLKFVRIDFLCDGRLVFGAQAYYPRVSPESDCCSGGTYQCWQALVMTIPDNPFDDRIYARTWMCGNSNISTSRQYGLPGQIGYGRFGVAPCSGTWITIGP